MPLSNLDIVIGLFFVFLVLSLICMAINEWISQLLALRSGTLRNGIKQMLDDDLAEQLYSHPLVRSLGNQGRFDRLLGRPGDPSYIPNNVFASALLDVANQGGGASAGSRSTLEKLPAGRARDALLALHDQADTDADSAKKVAEKWFDHAMERVSGQYKRRIQLVSIVVAILIAVVANADAAVIASSLKREPALREAMLALAQETVQQQGFFAATPHPEASAAGMAQVGEGTPVASSDPAAGSVDEERIARLVDQMEELSLPLGWDKTPLPRSNNEWAAKLMGLLVTAAAVSLGAPFWFDILSRIINIRAAGVRPSSGDASG